MLIIPTTLHFHYLTFSDASQGISAYGQTGNISRDYFGHGQHGTFQNINWMSAKQKRVCFSSVGAKIISTTTSIKRSAHIVKRIQSVSASPLSVLSVLTVELHGLQQTITTLHDGTDYCLRQTVSRIRKSFECGYISAIKWIPSVQNIANALRKSNPCSHELLNKALVYGTLQKNVIFIKFEAYHIWPRLAYSFTCLGHLSLICLIIFNFAVFSVEYLVLSVVI